MNQTNIGRRSLSSWFTGVTLALLVAPAAHAASLQEVGGDWANGVTGLPGDVSMHLYVPDDVATNPPILALIHYCGGTASAVFGQAQGGGLVSAADQYGFIVVVPSSGRCWDVQSNETWTREGGGDSHAIRQMVQYAIAMHGGNADRVYATGDSSGGMMTELLLALYPDVFKAGSAFAGMPAGCRGANESGDGGGYSGACAGGSVSHTPEEWGDIVRMMHPGYTGHRPRVQLFHGDNDTIIRYPNHTEAIKEWTNVLGLTTSPNSTETVPLGDHQATRQKWTNACGHVVLDAHTSIGGDHGPSDALFESQYVIPFLGLDQIGAVDPEVEDCGMAGAGGGGGAGGNAAGGVSGASGRNDGGAAGGSGSGNGGIAGSIEVAGGGSAGTAAESAGGNGGVAGMPQNAGQGGGGANGGTPGASGVGGTAGTGGTSAGSGNAGVGSGGISSAGAAGRPSPLDDPGASDADSKSEACNCTFVGAPSTMPRGRGAMIAVVLGLLAFGRRRRG